MQFCYSLGSYQPFQALHLLTASLLECDSTTGAGHFQHQSLASSEEGQERHLPSSTATDLYSCGHNECQGVHQQLAQGCQLCAPNTEMGGTTCML